MKRANRSFTALFDTDEYIVYNHAGGSKFAEWERRQQQLHDSSGHKKQVRIKPFHTPPRTSSEGAMINYIRQEQASGHPYYQSACITLPRLHFGAQESTPDETSREVPSGFEPKQFDTLRWRKHAHRNDFVNNALAKVIIDVSRVDMERTPRFFSLHRPIKSICAAPWSNDWESGLRLNHYLGSWESYSFRNDARRGNERSFENE